MDHGNLIREEVQQAVFHNSMCLTSTDLHDDPGPGNLALNLPDQVMNQLLIPVFINVFQISPISFNASSVAFASASSNLLNAVPI